jgi:multiple sugar transport system permease protein
VVTTLAAVAVVWIFLLHGRYGLLNYALSWLGLHPVDWLGDPRWAMPSIVLLSVWKNFGYNMIILLAGLQAIPDDLYEAAQLDGAGPGAMFRHVTVPSLAPMLLMVSILTMAGHFQIFAEPYVMTQGGPAQRTVTVLYLMYENGFKWWSLGSASSVAFVLFLFMLAFSLVQARVARSAAFA